MWGRSTKQRKSAVRRMAEVRHQEHEHARVFGSTPQRLFGRKLESVKEAQARAQRAAAESKLKAKKQAKLQGRKPKAKQALN